MERDYFNMVAAASQVVGRPNATKREIVGVLERTSRERGVQLDKDQINKAWKRFHAVPTSRVFAA